MTLQEKILEALGERALKPRALYERLSGDSPAAIDCALGALMRSGKVTLERGHYQRTKLRPLRDDPVPRSTVPPLTPSQPPVPTLSQREQEIAELAAAGKTNREIAQQLGLKLGTVEVYKANIRKKTGGAKLERRAETQPAPKSPAAPSAAPPLTAAPSHEGAEVATVGAALSPKEAPRSNGARPALPAGLKARLVEVQRRKAEELKDLLEQVGLKRQELADVEAMVRILTEVGQV